MQVILDTSALIRFFTNDIPEKAAKVEKLLEEKEVLVPDVVFPELEYVLTKGYSSPRNHIVTAFRFLSAQKNIKISSHVQQAIEFFANSKLDIADSIIAAHSLKTSLASFDKELLQSVGVKQYWENNF